MTLRYEKYQNKWSLTREYPICYSIYFVPIVFNCPEEIDLEEDLDTVNIDDSIHEDCGVIIIRGYILI